MGILAAAALAPLPAVPSRRETLAVHLEAEGLLAGAAGPLFLGGVRGSGDVRDALAEGVLSALGDGVAGSGADRSEVHIFEGGVLGEGVDGVDELETEGEVGQLVDGGQIEEGVLAELLVHPVIIILIRPTPRAPPRPSSHFIALPQGQADAAHLV